MSKIAELMNRNNGVIRHSYKLILGAVHDNMVSGGNSEVLTAFNTINGQMLKLINAASMSHNSVDDCLITISEATSDLFYSCEDDDGWVHREIIRDIFGAFVDDEYFIETIVGNTHDSTCIKEDESHPVSPIVSAMMRRVSASQVSEHVFVDDDDFKDFCDGVSYLSFLNNFTTKPLLDKDSQGSTAKLHSWLIDMCNQGNLTFAQAVAYITEVSILDIELDDEEVNIDISDYIAVDIADYLANTVHELTKEQQSVLAQTIGASVEHLDAHHCLDVVELIDCMQESDVDQLPPAAVLARMSALYSNRAEISRVRNTVEKMKKFNKCFKETR